MMNALGITCLCVVALVVSMTAEAASLKVSPAQFMVQDVEPGKLYDIYAETGLRLTVFNEDDAARTWRLSTHRPSERGRWEKGYAEIPDATWCWFGENEIALSPNSAGFGHVFLRIPDDEQYYNQHWIVTLNVAGQSGGLGLGLAVDIRMQIETKSKNDLTSPPHGPLALEPAALLFEDVQPGIPHRASVRLHNNDSVSRTYAIGSLFLDKKHEAKTYLTQSYQLLPSHEWLKHDTSLAVEPGSARSLELTLKIPEEAAHFGRKWEDCILVQPDEGRAGFVRVRIETRPPQAAQISNGGNS